jgi:hypothetical protein
MIDLTSMINDDDITPAADDFEHLPAPARTSRFHPQDLELPSGATVQIPNNCCNELFTVSDVARHRKERKIAAALDKLLSRKRCQPTPTSQRLHAGHASSHPTASPDSQALLTGMARCTFMLDLQSATKDVDDPNKKRLQIATKGRKRWSVSNKCSMEMVLRSSPSASAVDDWVVRLALEQAIIASTFFQNCGAVYLMSDGGHKGSQVKLLSGWDEHDTSQTPDGSVRAIVLDIDASGKKSEDVATGCVCSLEKIGVETIDGLTNDSGAGAPESLEAELAKENKMAKAVALSESCGLHDLQSDFRLPMRHCMGDGGLDNRNAMQLTRAVFDMFAKFKDNFATDTWKRALSRTWKTVQGGRRGGAEGSSCNNPRTNDDSLVDTRKTCTFHPETLGHHMQNGTVRCELLLDERG